MRRFLVLALLLTLAWIPADVAEARGGRGGAFGGGAPGGTRGSSARRKKDQTELRLRAQRENRASLLRDAVRDAR